MSDEQLSRYAPIVGDLDAFIAAACRPLPRVIWANPLRRDPEEIAAEVARLAPEAVPLPWRPHSWRLPPESKPGRWPAWLFGELHGHEEASVLAADVVGARPGERVLDMCAAPGGKTAVMAVAMSDRGTLMALERKYGRVSSLRRTLDRLGVTCAAVTCGDGAHAAAVPGGYDRVLVDAPCTCEGTSRKTDGRSHGVAPGYRASIVQVQKSLLRRALKIVRPGGRVVYSTCTYAPEENEAVIEAAPADAFVIEPIPPRRGLDLAPGLTAWGEQRFRPDMVNAARLWPHHNDTGGFFIAALRRIA